MVKISKLLKRDGNLNTIKTNKYKTINITIKFTLHYKEINKAKLAILGTSLTDSCKKYTNKVEMSKAKDKLYDIQFLSYPSLVADLSVFTISYSFINAKFLKDISDKDYIDFINETLFNPLFTEEKTLELKRNIIDSINRSLDIPSVLSSENFYKEVGKDNRDFLRYSNDIVADLQTISNDEIIDLYNELFKSNIEVFLIGDYSLELHDYLSKIKSNGQIKANLDVKQLFNSREIDIKKDVSQSSLIVSYTSPVARNSKDYYAFFLANIMFGGIPNSLLFQEVREKLSLCYRIQAFSLKYEGMCLVKTDIDGNNKDKALNEIRKQFDRLRNLDFDPSLLDIAKILLVNNSCNIDDDLEYLIDYTHNGLITDNFETVEEFSNKINSITLKDIQEVLKGYKEYIVYFLEGTKHE